MGAILTVVKIVVGIVVALVVSVTVNDLFYSPPEDKNSLCRVQNCGQTDPNYVEARIVGGRYATKDEFPFQVAITDSDGDVFCGGSMINDLWTISAAHCFFTDDGIQMNPREIRVSVGIRDVKEIPFNEIEVDKFRVHPHYRFGYSYDHDIALIKAKQSIKASSINFVSPICLPFDDLDEDATFVKVAGFGLIEDDGKEMSSRLKMTTLQIVSDDFCKEKYKNDYNANLMICAGAPNLSGGQDTCQGDSGGPLAIRNKNAAYVLKGITSYGERCGYKDIPGVYTKVSYYLQWICETIDD